MILGVIERKPPFSGDGAQSLRDLPPSRWVASLDVEPHIGRCDTSRCFIERDFLIFAVQGPQQKTNRVTIFGQDRDLGMRFSRRLSADVLSDRRHSNATRRSVVAQFEMFILRPRRRCRPLCIGGYPRQGPRRLRRLKSERVRSNFHTAR